ncbi:uncharacterized protein LOC131852782 isoform X2 [Achroia grisella]|uniref:uncharacterized protein LOC131852782 isoform X2 n=1 Tax=Achroia grisella TaxID=688607 RepID=UPI0027D31273|nr:uncharacterized protein LOC131852782 isoform X2 [Achroia grisella]
MATSQENIVIDSSQYTPVYLIQNPGAIQGRSYVVTQNAVEEQIPVSDNLKTFYENSGILENNIVNNVANVSKPRILKKQDNKVGNNLKLASFLLPKNVQTNKQYVPINNLVLKPVTTSPTVVTTVVNTVPKVTVERKIVKMKNLPNVLKPRQERTLSKIKPKENTRSPSPSKHTSVQLLKLGETYHSLNELNDAQMKMVNQALKIFSDPEKIPVEPTYDPVTNTRFIYKVVSPRDLTVVGKNKFVIKNKKEEIKKEIKKVQKIVTTEPEMEVQLPTLKQEPEELETPVETKVTRSGRKVKFPKQIVPEDAPHKPRKKSGTVVSCFQCSTEFCSLYRLQKHYENHPTHIPAKIHSNLFHCLLAIIKSGSEEDQANIFLQQLEQLIEKIKSLLPCLLKKIDGCEGKLCTVNDDIGKLFGMNPGKYNFTMDALTCIKDKDGYCRHNPPPKTNQFNADLSKPSQLWLSKHNKEIANTENDIGDCARINAVDKWPTASKRIWKLKQQKSQELKAKRIRISSESDSVIELGVEDLINFNAPNEQSAINMSPKSINVLDNNSISNDKNNDEIITQESNTVIANPIKHKKGPHTQFHSTHFDIRSSPIKTSATLVNKIKIDPEKIAQYSRVQMIRPLDLDKGQNSATQPQEIATQPNSDDNCDLQELLRESLIELTCKEPVVTNDINFHTTKNWDMNSSVDKTDNYMKTNSLIEPSLIHVKDNDQLDKLPLNNINQSDHLSSSDNRLQTDQGQSVLNFLESLGNECLAYPETDIRNNTVDFQLDLFSFHNS